MCINVACRADVAVPQPLLNLLQAHAIGIEQTGAAMAQIVKAGVGAADAGHDPLELLRDRPGHQVPADLVGEHVPGGIVP